MLQALQVGDAVLVIMKSSLLLIAADNHMVERPVIFDVGLRALERRLKGEQTLSQYSGLAPIVVPPIVVIFGSIHFAFAFSFPSLTPFRQREDFAFGFRKKFGKFDLRFYLGNFIVSSLPE